MHKALLKVDVHEEAGLCWVTFARLRQLNSADGGHAALDAHHVADNGLGHLLTRGEAERTGLLVLVEDVHGAG